MVKTKKRRRSRCEKCGLNITREEHAAGETLCVVCRAARRLGFGHWETVFDRDKGRGEIPANLKERYPELAE